MSATNRRREEALYVTYQGSRHGHIIPWDDALALAEAGRTMIGREFLDAMLRGELPLPPILHPEDSAFGAPIGERNQ